MSSGFFFNAVLTNDFKRTVLPLSSKFSFELKYHFFVLLVLFWYLLLSESSSSRSLSKLAGSRFINFNSCIFYPKDVIFSFLKELRGQFKAAATSKMECFVIIVNGWKPLTIITKHSIFDVAVPLDPPLVLVIFL